jgi:hypothetical protein
VRLDVVGVVVVVGGGRGVFRGAWADTAWTDTAWTDTAWTDTVTLDLWLLASLLVRHVLLLCALDRSSSQLDV